MFWCRMLTHQGLSCQDSAHWNAPKSWIVVHVGLERWEWNGERLGEYVGLCGEKFGLGRSSPVPSTVTNLVETVSVAVTGLLACIA